MLQKRGNELQERRNHAVKSKDTLRQGRNSTESWLPVLVLGSGDVIIASIPHTCFVRDLVHLLLRVWECLLDQFRCLMMGALSEPLVKLMVNISKFDTLCLWTAT